MANRGTSKIGRLLFGPLLALAAAGANAAPLARTASGDLSGLSQGTVTAYLGIPFAAPPIGANRWRAPQPATPWQGVRAADKFGASCYQGITPGGFGPWTHEYVVGDAVSEDCLYLNVWSPAKADARLPVIVYIHGGGFQSGSGSVPIYDGRNLAEQGVVVVTINYRLGVFGFLAHPDLTREARQAGSAPANWGMLDQIAALKWVRANIAAFGGDPGRVVIAGQSAGSMAVHELVISPLARGLFQRAIAESGLPSIVPSPSLVQAEQGGMAFAESVHAVSLDDLRKVAPDRLLKAAGPGLRYGPITDGVFMPEAPDQMVAEGHFNDVPMIVGLQADEASGMRPDYGAATADGFKQSLTQYFGGKADQFAALYPSSTDSERANSAKQVLRDRGLGSMLAWGESRAASAHSPVYAYYFSHVEPGAQSARYGAFHSSELPYWFRTLDASPERGFTAIDETISAETSRYWVNFARAGDPNEPGLPRWPAFDPRAPQVLEIGDTTTVRPLLPPDKLAALRAFIAKGGQLNIF